MWDRKFLLCILRLHIIPLLAQLDALSNEDIVTLGNRDFLEKEAHPWIRDLWAGETSNYEAMAANDKLGVEPEEGPEDLDPDMARIANFK